MEGKRFLGSRSNVIDKPSATAINQKENSDDGALNSRFRGFARISSQGQIVIKKFVKLH